MKFKFPFRKKKVLQAKPLSDDRIELGFPGSSPFELNATEWLAPEALHRHSLVIGKPDTGKTTLLKRLAIAAMNRDWSLFVIDTDGDLAPALAEFVPARRVGETAYFDLSDTEHVVGLNLLDRCNEAFTNQIAEHIIHASQLLRQDRWGIRQEDVLRLSLSTLLRVNEVLAERDEEQFTLIDLPRLFDQPSFRRRLLHDYVPDFELLMWWADYFDRMPRDLQAEVVRPVTAWIRVLAQNPVLRSVLGQSRSAIHFRDLLSERRITLVNLAHDAIPADMRAWLGTLLTSAFATAVCQEKDPDERSARGRLLVVLNGVQPVTLIDEFAGLPNFERHGVSFVFSGQSLNELDAVQPRLSSVLLANVANLFVFRSTAPDAERLAMELGAESKEVDLVNLPDRECYALTHVGGRRQPARRVELVAPLALGSGARREQIIRRMEPLTSSADQVAEARQQFERHWYGCDDDLGRMLIADQPLPQDPSGSAKATP
jgi:hypothetical protein